MTSDSEHEHLWSGVSPDAYCLGCLDERPEKQQAESDRFRGEVRAKIESERKLAKVINGGSL